MAATGRIDEHQHQVNLLRWTQLNLGRFPELRYFHAIPNGAKLPYTKNQDGSHYSNQGIRLKKEGLKRGVPDTSLPVARGPYHGLYIELKADDGKPTPEQIDFARFLNRQGYLAVFCFGWENAASVLEWYLTLPEFEKDASVPLPAQAHLPEE